MLWHRYGIRSIPSEDDIDIILAGERVQVYEWDMAPGLTEVTLGRRIYLARHLTGPWRRWLKLHGLAHVLLHRGNQVHLFGRDSVQVGCQERKADLVAGWMVFGPLRISLTALTVADLAELGDVPEEAVTRWYEAAQHEIWQATVIFGSARRGGERE